MLKTVKPHETVFLEVIGQPGDFPVNRIFCVGRNYADHAREMGGNPDREPPFFFCKFADAIAANHSAITYPPKTDNLHHEVELVLAIGQGGVQIAGDSARAHIFGYAVGLDLTRRDLQTIARHQGRPWDMAKNFPMSAPMTAINPAEQIGHPRNGAIWLDVDGERRQNGRLEDMIWSCEEIIQHLSHYTALRAGDLIMTGTPAGVGPVLPGQRIQAGAANLPLLDVSMAPGLQDHHPSSST